MIQTNFVPIVRVAVISQNRILDLSLPTNIPIREVILSIETLLMVDLEKDKFPTAQLTLGKLGQTPFNPDTTLDAVEVFDGDLLIFQSKIEPEDTTPSVVEDIAQISTLLAAPSARLFREQFNRAAALQFLIVSSALTIVFFLIRFTAYIPHNAVVLLMACGVLMNLAILVSAFILNRRPKNAKIASLYAMWGVGGLFISILWITKDEVNSVSLFCAFAVIHALIWIGSFQFKAHRAGWTAFLATTGISSVVTAVYCIWHISSSIIGCFLFLSAMGYQLYASTIAIYFARLPLPHVPTIGEKVVDILSKSALQNLQTQVIDAREYQNGVIASSVLLQGVSAMCLVSDHWTSWVIIALGVLGTMLRSRIWVERKDKSWMIASVFIVPLAVIAHELWIGNILRVVIVSGILFIASLIYIAICFNPTLTNVETFPLPLRHAMTLVSYIIDVVLVVGVVYLTGLYAQVLHR